MLARKRDLVGDRLASLAFGNKLETDRGAENEDAFPRPEIQLESAP
jgi:hypothetical protein